MESAAQEDRSDHGIVDQRPVSQRRLRPWEDFDAASVDLEPEVGD